ncbi:MAG TPA: hypothetical protein VE439_09215 [Anaerolineae bacterium]|nr:hypothetical protein [Anaerolineae bacterium]
MKTYRITSWYKFLRYVAIILGIPTIAINVLALIQVLELRNEVSPIITLFFMLLLYMVLREFDTVLIQDNGLITFRSPIRKVTVVLGDIASIKPFFLHHIIIKHAAGRTFVPRYIEDLSDLLHTVKSMNPNIEVSV